MITQLLPITPAQTWLFKYFLPPFEWYDRLEFFIEGTPSENLLKVEKIVLNLIQRHDGLRTTFSKKENQWMQVIHPDIGDIATVVCLSENITPTEEVKICQSSFYVHELPLFKLFLTPSCSQKTHIVTLFHHSIIDYIGLTVFFKEFCLLLMRQPLEPKYQSNSDYGKALEKITSSLELSKSHKFWSEKLKDTLSINFKPSLEKYAKNIRKVISQQKAEIILKKTKKMFGVSSLQEVLSAPLYKALEKISGHSKVVVSHKLHGRNFGEWDFRFFSTVGNYAINVPIACDLVDAVGWSELIKRINLELSLIPQSGLTYDLTPEIPYPDSALSLVRINYMGNLYIPLLPGIEAEFKTCIKRIHHPNQPLTAHVEIFLYFLEKELIVEVAYDGINVSSDWAAELTETYVSQLYSLVEYVGQYES